MSSTFSYPDGDRNTISIESMSSGDELKSFFQICKGTAYIDGVFQLADGTNHMNVDRFVKLVHLMGNTQLPKEITEFYLLGCKPNKETTPEVQEKHGSTHALWKLGETVVEGVFFLRDAEWFYAGMAMYESNFGSSQFSIQLKDLLPSSIQGLSVFVNHPDLLSKSITTGEMVIQLFKLLRAFLPEFAPDSTCDPKPSALKLNIPETSTAEEVNTELVLRMLSSDSDKDTKKFGRMCLVKKEIFEALDGEVVPLGSTSLDSFRRLGWNAIQQALIYVLRASDNKSFFQYKKALYENKVKVVESAFYGANDTKFGSIPGVRVFVHPHKIESETPFYGALGHGSTYASEVLFNKFLSNYGVLEEAVVDGEFNPEFRPWAVSLLSLMAFETVWKSQ